MTAFKTDFSFTSSQQE